ncbi:hypothetical protein F2Q69_00004278 [Brassica cretica]|uniref:F-box associated beta-propeller type 1 domain-containing protein n=1 Tax=Brassica cretica TaxID=69181 RepID=A0A8S9PEK5_BRACR|nr:hypothetical protein F2Q69_00004278 [Brassica cretica]
MRLTGCWLRNELELGRYKARAWSLRSDRAENAFGCCVATFFELLSDDSRFFRKAFRKEESISKKYLSKKVSTFSSSGILTLTSLQPFSTPTIIGFGEDRLSLLSEHKDETMIQVWVTNKVIDEIVSWRKYFNVTYEIVTRSKYFNVFPPCLSILSTSNFPTYFIHKTNRIMLWYEKEDHQDENIYVNLYEIGGGEVKKLVETGRHRRWDMCDVPKLCYVFVPNLVPVPE